MTSSNSSATGGRKKPSVRTLKKKADTLFSELIRRRSVNSLGMCRCASCLKWYYWKNMDAGHYVSRNHNTVRYDPRNVHPQCKKCNRFREGNKSGYTLFLHSKYGMETIEELNQAQYQVKRFKVDELQEMIKEWREELRKLRKEQG